MLADICPRTYIPPLVGPLTGPQDWGGWMAASRRWRRAHQVRPAEDQLSRRIAERLDAERCQVMDETGTPCPDKAYEYGYCAKHWGR